MMLPEAREVFGAFLAPLSLDEFLDVALSGRFRAVPHDGAAARLQLLGPDQIVRIVIDRAAVGSVKARLHPIHREE